MHILVTICARGGSKGIPGKNVKSVAGRPLLAYTVAHALQFAELHGANVALSTDDEVIRSVAAEYGLQTDYVRPAPLAGDATGKVEVIAALLRDTEMRNGKQYDLVLDLDVVSPLRTQDDLEQALTQITADTGALNLFSVSPARRNPYYTMVERGDGGYCHLCKKPDTEVLARQQAPVVYELNGSFYFYRKEFFDAGHTSVMTERALAYVVPHTCFDLDEPLEFAFLEFLIEQGKLGFSL